MHGLEKAEGLLVMMKLQEYKIFALGLLGLLYVMAPAQVYAQPTKPRERSVAFSKPNDVRKHRGSHKHRGKKALNKSKSSRTRKPVTYHQWLTQPGPGMRGMFPPLHTGIMTFVMFAGAVGITIWGHVALEERNRLEKELLQAAQQGNHNPSQRAALAAQYAAKNNDYAAADGTAKFALGFGWSMTAAFGTLSGMMIYLFANPPSHVVRDIPKPPSKLRASLSKGSTCLLHCSP